MSAVIDILLSSLTAIGQLATCVGIGVIMTKRELLTPTISKGLSALSMNLFLPAFMFTEIFNCEKCSQGGNKTCTEYDDRCVPVAELVSRSYFLFLWPVVVVFVGMLLGKLVVLCARTPNDGAFAGLHETVTTSVMFANASTWPILLFNAITPTLISENLVTVNPVMYLPIYLVLDPMLKWAIGSNIFGLSDIKNKKQSDKKTREANVGDMEKELLTSSSSSNETDSDEDGIPVQWLPADLDLATQGDMEIEDVIVPGKKLRGSKFAKVCKGIYVVLKNSLVPPVIATLAGLLAAALVSIPHPLWIEKAWLFIWQAIKLFGACVVPVNLLILGSSMSKGAKWDKVPLPTNIGVTVAKLFILPAVSTPIVWCLIRVFPPSSAAAWLVALVVTCVPTANQIAIMVELSGRDKEAMGTMVMTQLFATPVSLTLWLTVFPTLLQQEWFLPADRRLYND